MTFHIPSGTTVSICKVDDEDRRWKSHTTKRDLLFTNEHRDGSTYGSSGAVIFKEGDWLILTRRERVKT